MRILYRADGGHPIGTGHLFRAVRILKTLASQSSLGANLVLADDEAGLRIATEAPAQVTVLPPRSDHNAVKPVFNAGPVLKLLSEKRYDLLVVDMLDTPEADMRGLSTAGVPIVTFDDRGPGRRFADAIINVLVEEPEPEALSPACLLFEGGEYVVLDPAFAEAHATFANHGPMKRIFVSMGGADAAGLSLKAARALRHLDGLEEVRFSIGPAYPHRSALETELSSAPWRFELLSGLPSLIGCYHWCDLALIAGGLTMWEVCCAGVPAVAICQPIDHQQELAARLAAKGAMATVGFGLDASEEQIAQAITELSPSDVRREMSARGPSLIDGRGAGRVAEILQDVANRNIG